jgi:hypothetical protein
MKLATGIIFSLLVITILFFECNDSKTNGTTATKDTVLVGASPIQNGGFESQVQWGAHLVSICACNDCHTPKKFTEHGMEFDSSLLLSGHPSKMPPPEFDRKMMESKGLIGTNDLTAWVGPWGISYTANITSDQTGIGSWTEDQFLLCIREGKWKGLKNSRSLMPPMPWFTYRLMTDNELKAIFAYLKSTKPIENVEPPIVPPVTMQQKP